MKWVYLNHVSNAFVTLDGEIVDEVTKLNERYRVRSTGKEYISLQHAKDAVDKQTQMGGSK